MSRFNLVYLFTLCAVLWSCKGSHSLKIIASKGMPQEINVRKWFKAELSELARMNDSSNLPNFLLDECYQCKCHIPLISADMPVDCFYEFTASLSDNELRKIATHKDCYQLKTECRSETPCQSDQNSVRNKFEIIQHEYELRRISDSLNKQLDHAFSIAPGFIDTNLYYVSNMKQAGWSEENIYSIYKFNSNGTFLHFQFQDNNFPSLDKADKTQGYYRVSQKTKTLKTEYYWVDKKTLAINKTETYFIGLKNGLAMVGFSNQNRNTQLKHPTKYKKYRQLIFVHP